MPPGLPSRAALAVVIFAAALLLFSRNASFPSNYHPDEPDKVRQVLTEDWNFHHPLLVLRSVCLLRTWLPDPSDPEAVVQTGRWLSAAWAAAAAACLALLAWELAGPLAALAAGFLVTLNTQFFELAHYFKEDTALAFGTSLCALIFARQWGRAGICPPLLMGASWGLAASAKYAGIGLALLPIALLAAPGITRPSRAKRAIICLLAFAAVFVLINFPMLPMAAQAAGGLAREVDYAVGGHMGITRSVPHGVYFAVLANATNPGVWVLLSLYAVILLVSLTPSGFLPASWHRALGTSHVRIPDYLLTMFVVITFVSYSFIPKTHHRYMLPITGLLLVFAAVGAFRVRSAPFRVLAMVALAAAIVLSALSTLECLRAFGADTRADLRGFLLKSVPADSLIVTDRRVALPDDLPFRIVARRFAADAGSLAELRAAGPTFVIVCQGDFGRFLIEGQKPTDSASPDYWRRREFYLALFASGEPVWQREPGRLTYLQPGIRVFRLLP